jgi:hypothetical protein
MINSTPEGGTRDPFFRAARQLAANKKLPGGVYLKTREATDALGISKATLYRRKAEGWFVMGIHYVTTGPNSRCTFLWNVDECRKVQGDWTAPETVQ